MSCPSEASRSFPSAAPGHCSSDGLFGIEDSFVQSWTDERDHVAKLAKIRVKRWAIFVVKAALRFEIWWTKCVEVDAQKARQSTILSKFKLGLDHGSHLVWYVTCLPPLGKKFVFLLQKPAADSKIRCAYGVACVPPEPPRLPRRLRSPR